jgi:hypothetical protein
MPAMHVRAARSDVDDGSPMAWATFENVPAGRYDVEIRTEAPARGAVTIQVGSHDRQTFELPLAARARFPLRLPAGARAVRVVPDAALRPLVRALELVPVSLVPNAVGLAQASKRYGLADVFFFDDAVFVEEDGFWIRGGATSAFAIAPPADAPTIRLELANGAAANAVQLDLPGQAAQTVRLRASETRTFDVVVPASGLVQVKLTSPAGFRPSDVSASRDTRYLGVRVVVR